MSEFDAGRCLPLLLDVAVKSLAVSAAALAALPALHRASASARHLVLLVGLGVLLGLPALMPLLPRQELPHSPRAEPLGFRLATPRLRGQRSDGPGGFSSPAKAGVRSPEAQGFSPGKEGDPPAAPVAVLPPLPQPPVKPPVLASPPPIRPAWLILGWLVGVLVCAGRFLAAQARVWRLTRRCPPLPPSLLSESEAGGFTSLLAARKTGPAGTPPMIWGWPRPTLLLPPDAVDWPAARLRAVLRHEAAHVRRRDWLTQTLAQAACAVYWFNPLVWLLAARMNAEAERACDDAVLLSGIPPTDYAQDLLAVARSLSLGRAARQASFGAVAMARRSPVRGRLEAILDSRRPRRPATRRAAALALAVALAFAAPLAALRPAAHADAPAAAPPAPPAGVPTEADVAKVRLHLQSLERDQLVYDWTCSQPNMLTAAQTAEVDRLIQLMEFERGFERFDAQEKAEYRRARAEAKKPHSKREREEIWRTIFGYEHTPPIVLKRQHDFDQGVARLKAKVDMLPTYQVVRETRLYAFDGKIALDKTRLEAMQMERSLGYPLHLSEDSITSMAEMGFQWEKRGWMSRTESVHVSLLEQKLQQRKRLDDADIDSLIAILHEPSKTPSVSRTNVMFLFRSLPDASPAQRQKICEAVTPFLTSRDKWERKFAEEVLKKFGGGTPAPAPLQKAQAAPMTATLLTRPQPIPQADQTGVPTMTSIKGIKTTLLKTAAFATLAAGLTSPAAHAQPAKPVPHAAADAPHWNRLVLQHAALGTVMALTRWGRGGSEPKGVKHLVFMMGSNTLLVNATPDGFAQVQEIVRRLDVAPRRVQVGVMAVTVTAADLKVSGVRFDRVALDSMGTAGDPPHGFMEAGTGEAIAVYRAALTRQGAIGQSPVVAADSYTEAAVDFSGVSSEIGIKRIILGVMPRVNGDNSVTLQLRPTFSRLVAGRTNPDGTPLIETKEVHTSRTLSSGATLLLVSSLPGATGASSRYLLLFVTPTVLPDRNSASAPFSGLPRV